MDLPVGIATLQHTDRWIGIPLCATLTLARKIISRRAPAVRRPRKILFIKFAEQGSTVLAYPAIRRATEMVGRENVYFVVFADNRFILDAMEVIPAENIITIPTQSPRSGDPADVQLHTARRATIPRLRRWWQGVLFPAV